MLTLQYLKRRSNGELYLKKVKKRPVVLKSRELTNRGNVLFCIEIYLRLDELKPTPVRSRSRKINVEISAISLYPARIYNYVYEGMYQIFTIPKNINYPIRRPLLYTPIVNSLNFYSSELLRQLVRPHSRQ